MPEQQQRKQASPPTFTVEFGDSHCRTITVNVLRRRVRGRFSIAAMHSRPGGGRDVGTMNAMPDIPGLRMTVSPLPGGRAKCVIYDPLDEDTREAKELKENIVRVMNRSRIAQADRVKTVERTEQELNPDEYKTLVVELRRKVEEEPTCAVLVKGQLPSKEQVALMDGREINDPWSTNPRKPRHKDEVEEYERGLDATAQY